MRFAPTIVQAAALTTVVCVSCTEPTAQSSDTNRLHPPMLWPTAATRVVEVAGGSLALEVSVWLRNQTTSALQVQTTPACAPYVALFPDSTGEQATSIDPSTACQPGGQELSVPAGDSTVLRRTIPADSLASFASGTYGVNWAYISEGYLTAGWAGAVQLPLKLPN
jgi:hypothetical protein